MRRACSLALAADTVTITATNGAHDTPALRSSPTASSLPFAAAPAPTTITPTLLSAAATSPTQLLVALPVPSTFVTYLDGPGPIALTLPGPDCSAILNITNSAGTPTTLLDCTISNTPTPMLTVNLAESSPSGPGDLVNIHASHLASDKPKLLGKADGTGHPYATRTTPLAVHPSATSARAISPTRIEVELPVPSFLLNAAGEPTTTLTANDCAAVLTVTTANGAAKALSRCSVDSAATGNAVLTVELDAGESITDGGVLSLLPLGPSSAAPSIRAGPNTSTPALAPHPNALPILPTIISAHIISPSFAVVQLPYASRIHNGGAAVSTQAVCGSLITVMAATGQDKALNALCTTLTDSNALTIDLSTDTGLGLSTNFTFAIGDSLNLLPRSTTPRFATYEASTVGAAYSPRSRPIPLSPALSYAVAIFANVIEIQLPLPGYLFDASGTPVSNLTDCTPILSFTPTKASYGCSLAPNSTLLTVSGATWQDGDRVNLAPSHPASNSPSLRTASDPSSAPFRAAPAAFALPIRPALTPTAIAIDSRTILVTLPVPTRVALATNSSALASNSTLSTIPRLEVTSPSGSAKPLAGSILTPTGTLTVILANTTSYAGGDTINLIAAVPSGGTFHLYSAASPHTPYAPRPIPTLIRPTLASAVASDPTTILVTLPGASVLLSPSGAFVPSLSNCSEVFTISRSKTVTSCSLSRSPSGNTVLATVKLSGTPNNTYSEGDTINIAPTHPAPGKPQLAAGRPGAPSLAFYTPAATPITIAPTVTAATVTIGPGPAYTLTLTAPTPVKMSTNGGTTYVKTGLTEAHCEALVEHRAADGTVRDITGCEVDEDGALTLATDGFAPGKQSLVHRPHR